jgi:transcription antitermination protein NusB
VTETDKAAAKAAAPTAAPSNAKGAGKNAPRKPSTRRLSREAALQGLYQWLVSGAEAGVVDAHMREQEGFDKCDKKHFDLLLHGCIREASDLDAVLLRHARPPIFRRSNTVCC